MQYLLLIYESEAERSRATDEENAKLFTDYKTFTQEIGESGHLVGGEALDSISTATTVRVREGKTLTTDGPFAETKEQLGGYYMVEAENLDEAMAIAARIPSAKTGSIEVRPIKKYE